MSDIQIFKYQGSSIRTTKIDNETWWVLDDVCDILNISAISFIADEPEDSRTIIISDAQGLNQETTIISERGLFDLINGAPIDESYNFKDWLFSALTNIDSSTISIDELEGRIEGIADATNFMMSVFASYAENKEGPSVNIIYYPKSSFSGINFLNELMQAEYQKILTDVRSLNR